MAQYVSLLIFGLAAVVVYFGALTLPVRRGESPAKEFLFSGLTPTRIICSVVGSTISVAFLINGMLSYTGLYGTAPLVGGIFISFCIPMGMYVLARFAGRHANLGNDGENSTEQWDFYEFLGRRISSNMRRWGVVFFLIYSVALTVVEFIFFCFILHVLLPNPSPNYLLVASYFLIITACYVYTFGLRGVALTDVIQFFAIYIVLICLALIGAYASFQYGSNPARIIGIVFNTPITPERALFVDAGWRIDNFDLQLHAYSAMAIIGTFLFFSTTDIWFKLFALLYHDFSNGHSMSVVKPLSSRKAAALFCFIYPACCVIIFLFPLGLGVLFFNELSLSPMSPVKSAYTPLLPYNLVEQSLTRLTDLFLSLSYGSIGIMVAYACFVIFLAFATMTTMDAQIVAYCQLRNAWRRIEKGVDETVRDVRVRMLWFVFYSAGLFMLILLIAVFLKRENGDLAILIQRVTWFVGFCLIIGAVLISFNVFYLILTLRTGSVGGIEIIALNASIAVLYVAIVTAAIIYPGFISFLKLFPAAGKNTFQIVAPAVFSGLVITISGLIIREVRLRRGGS